MPDDERLTWDFIHEVLDVIERHGYRSSDSLHTSQAIGLISQVARIYEGTLDAPHGGYVAVPSSPRAAPQPPGPPTAILSAEQMKTLLAERDKAAEASTARHGAPGHAAPPSAGPQAAAGKEAGQ